MCLQLSQRQLCTVLSRKLTVSSPSPLARLFLTFLLACAARLAGVRCLCGKPERQAHHVLLGGHVPDFVHAQGGVKPAAQSLCDPGLHACTAAPHERQSLAELRAPAAHCTCPILRVGCKGVAVHHGQGVWGPQAALAGPPEGVQEAGGRRRQVHDSVVEWRLRLHPCIRQPVSSASTAESSPGQGCAPGLLLAPGQPAQHWRMKARPSMQKVATAPATLLLWVLSTR